MCVKVVTSASDASLSISKVTLSCSTQFFAFSCEVKVCGEGWIWDRSRSRHVGGEGTNLKPAVRLFLGAVLDELQDGGGVIAGVVLGTGSSGNRSNTHLVTVWEEDAGDELAVDDLVLLVHLVGDLGPVDDGVVLQPLEVDPRLTELHRHAVRPVGEGNLLLL